MATTEMTLQGDSIISLKRSINACEEENLHVHRQYGSSCGRGNSTEWLLSSCPCLHAFLGLQAAELEGPGLVEQGSSYILTTNVFTEHERSGSVTFHRPLDHTKGQG